MKIITFLYISIVIISIGNTVFSQTGESEFKIVVVNTEESKVMPLEPDFEIKNLNFTDANMNRQLDGEESGDIIFFIKNTGTVFLQQLKIRINEINGLTGLDYRRSYNVKGINLGDSTRVTVPFVGDEKLEEGLARFNIWVADSNSVKIKSAQITIPTKKVFKPPVFTWIYPDSVYELTEFPVVDIYGLVKTRTDIKGLKVYVNGQVPDDKKTFEVLITDFLEEYRIKRTLLLNEGDNEIKVEVKNNQGITTSETRIINYYIPKIDNTYIEKRLALVIGNANYTSGNELQNPVNDAKAVGEALQAVGFTVLSYFDADLRTIKKAMDEFGEQLQDYTVGLFYYAGHGMQVQGNNYLIPVDANPRVEQDVDYDCINAGRLLGKMEAANTNTNIVILDACRDNPFARNWSGRSSARPPGLAFMNAPSGSIIAYATSPGKTASDGTGKNGLYTEALLKYINVPGLSIEDFFKNVRALVEQRSNKTQTPWESTSLKGNFFFRIK